MTVRASVLIPTHDKHTTLPLAIDTALRQSVRELEVIVIGDGVTPAVRDVVERLMRTDGRLRFLDLPKGQHHGERYRHDAIAAAESDAIFYLCDDDLLLPDHVADLLTLLEEHNFVQSLNGYVRPSGEVRYYAADLSDPEDLAAHLWDDIQYCSVSITGTAHSRAFYEAVGARWDTTPPGQWPDHHQWRKLMRHPEFRGATSTRMTALQFPTSADGRDRWSPTERVAELVPWHELVMRPGAQSQIDARGRAGAIAQLATERRELARLRHDVAWQREQIERQSADLAWLDEQYRTHVQDLAWLTEQHARLQATLTRLRSRRKRQRDGGS